LFTLRCPDIVLSKNKATKIKDCLILFFKFVRIRIARILAKASGKPMIKGFVGFLSLKRTQQLTPSILKKHQSKIKIYLI
jgi:hypothetical protein